MKNTKTQLWARWVTTTMTRIPVLIVALACCPVADAMDIWGQGEVPRITNPADVPHTLEEIWSGYDAHYDTHNPLEVVIHKTWEVPGGVVVNWVQLTVGTFQGQKAIVCGYFAYPKGATNLPAILFIQGGPQNGSSGPAEQWARRGYAAFVPNLNAQAAMVGEAAGLPNTEWGALAGAMQPRVVGFNVGKGTMDAVPSPRNYWLFPRQIAGRRIISFLMQQSQVNPEKIGVRGHSTGGQSAVYLSIDPRVAAVVPSVGGVGGYTYQHPIIIGNTRTTANMSDEMIEWHRNTMDARTFWKKMHAPILLMSAANDFHAPDWNCVEAVKLGTIDKRFISAPNLNHAFTPEVGVTDLLWFEHHLKGTFDFPETPEAKLSLTESDGIPRFTVRPPETDLKLKRVEVSYTDGRNPLTRFWISADSEKQADGSWQAKLPVVDNGEPLTAFANLVYAFEPVKGVNGHVEPQREMALTSDYAYVWPEALQSAGIQSNPDRTRLIDDFQRGMQDWTGSLRWGQNWRIETRKVAALSYLGPQGGDLMVEVNAPAPGIKIGIMVNRNFMQNHTGENLFYGFLDLPEKGWNTVRIKTSDLRNAYGQPLDDWHKLSSLTFCSAAYLTGQVKGNIAQAAKRHGSKRNVDLGQLPDQVSGWSEDYYTDAGEAYTEVNTFTRDDVLARARFRNLRWEGGSFVERSKPYVEEAYSQPGESK